MNTTCFLCFRSIFCCVSCCQASKLSQDNQVRKTSDLSHSAQLHWLMSCVACAPQMHQLTLHVIPADTSREQDDLCANCSDPQPLPSPPPSRIASSPGCLSAPHHSAGCCCDGCCCHSGVTRSIVNLPVKLAPASPAANDCNAQLQSAVAEISYRGFCLSSLSFSNDCCVFQCSGLD